MEAGLMLGANAVVYRSSKRYDRSQFKQRFLEYKDGYRQGIRYDDILPGSFDPEARLKEQDEDSVDAEFFYNSPLIWAAIKSLEDPELKLACFQAYNDWIAEFSDCNRDRLFGIGLIPSTGVADAIAETRRCFEDLKLKSVTMESWPNGSQSDSAPEDDRFWAFVEEAGIPVNMHISFSVSQFAAKNLGLTGGIAGAVGPRSRQRPKEDMAARGGFHHVMARMIIEGVFERFPRLKFLGAEINVGWIPDYLNRFDVQVKHDPGLREHITLLPSEYFRRNMAVNFLPDYFGVKARHRVGIDNMQWACDFPHSVSNWPIDAELAHDQMAKGGVSDEEAEKLLWRNCADWYGIPYEV
jgi:predicted TIM-barrel fold metal-dependent hydrolase